MFLKLNFFLPNQEKCLLLQRYYKTLLPINPSLEDMSLEPVLQESRTLARHHTDDDHALQPIQPAKPARDQYQLYEFSLHGRE